MAGSIQILLDKCTGCTLCVKSCPFGAIHMANKKAVIDMAKCTLCGACVPVCKFKAIELNKEASDGIVFHTYPLFIRNA